MFPWNETLSAVSDFNLLKAQSWKTKTKTKKTIKMSETLMLLNNTNSMPAGERLTGDEG